MFLKIFDENVAKLRQFNILFWKSSTAIEQIWLKYIHVIEHEENIDLPRSARLAVECCSSPGHCCC